MPPGNLVLSRTAVIFLLAFFATQWASVAKAETRIAAKAPALVGPLEHVAPLAHEAPLVIEALGKGTVPLSGQWQFHTGDDPAWAKPQYDSSHWEQISANQPWGMQGHPHLTGFAWYRTSFTVTPAPEAAPQFSLLVPEIRDAYEIYWNGRLIGQNGKLPPHPVWYLSQPVQTFALGQLQQGVLAIRVWKAPLLSDDSGQLGGFSAAPLIGSPEAIAAAQGAAEYQWLRSRQLHFAANLLCAAIAFLSFLLWLRTPSRWILFWTAGFAIAQPGTLLLAKAHLALRYPLAMGADQPLLAVQDVSLWILLLWLLSLHENRLFRRITRCLACIYFATSLLDGLVVALSWDPQWTRFAQLSDDALTIFSSPFELFPIVLVGYALFQRTRFDSARWLVAVLASLDEMLLVFSDTVKQGRQYTGWSIADKIDSPLFFLDGNGISLNTLAGSLLLAAIVYAVYASVREDQRRQDVLVREKMELVRESDRMRHHAEHDGLTGLWNHRMIVDRLREEMIRSLRDGTPLSVILADVDHFKRVNDTFGHLAGDLVLKEVGTVLSRTLRPYDCVGRYGGEEFLMILPNCGMESALLRAEQLRIAVQSAQIREGETPLQITASFGVAAAFPCDHEPASVIRAVDAALYRAKSSGRNCVVEAEMDSTIYS